MSWGLLKWPNEDDRMNMTEPWQRWTLIIELKQNWNQQTFWNRQTLTLRPRSSKEGVPAPLHTHTHTLSKQTQFHYQCYQMGLCLYIMLASCHICKKNVYLKCLLFKSTLFRSQLYFKYVRIWYISHYFI